jgi:hypothetical protein
VKHFFSAVIVGLSVLPVIVQGQSYVACARFTTSGHEVYFAVTNKPKTGDVLTISGEQNGQGEIIYRDAGGEYVYVAPLTEDDSSFIVVWRGASGYIAKVLSVSVQQSGALMVSRKLDVAGAGLPQVLQAGREQTMFVLVANSSPPGNVRDVIDIYALRDGAYKFAARVPTHKELSTVEKLAEAYDEAAIHQRSGIVVHP